MNIPKIPKLNKEKTIPEVDQNGIVPTEDNVPVLKVHMPGAPEGVFVEVGPSQCKRVYEEGMGSRLIIIVDEMAELLMPTKVNNEAGKQEDALKQEISMIIQSITQLGRSSKINMVLCTQRPDATIISGAIKNNSLSLDTKVLVRRKKKSTYLNEEPPRDL